MEYSIEILQKELDRINSAYERFVEKGTIDKEHILALSNRTKANGLQQAIAEIKQALQLQQTGVSKCTHEKTSFNQIRCNVCDDCGDIIEIDV